MDVALHYGTVLGRLITLFMVCYLPSPQALRISHRVERETRVTDKEAQSTMWRRKKRREAPSRPFSHSHLPLRATFYRERDVLIRGIAVAELRGKVTLNLAPNIPIVHFDTTQVPRSGLLQSCLWTFKKNCACFTLHTNRRGPFQAY